MRPESLLEPAQVESRDFLLRRKKGGLFLDMGAGKTATALSVLAEFKKFGIGPTLLVAPVRVMKTVWEQESELWQHLKGLTFAKLQGNVSERRKALAKTADVYLISPDCLPWLWKVLGRPPYPFEVLMIDESSFFKTVGSVRFRRMRYKVRHFRWRYIFTGTPQPNGLLDLWPQIFLLDLGKRLGTSMKMYKARFFHPIDEYRWVPLPGAQEKIFKLVQDLVIRVKAPKENKKTVEYVNVILPPKAREIYDELEAESLVELSSSSRISSVSAAVNTMKCRQVANGVVYIDTDFGTKTKVIHQEKLKATKALVDQTDSPVIVVYNFIHELTLLKETLKEYSPVVFSESKNVEQTVELWNKKKIQVLLLHPASGGHGINLQAGGHTMIWFALTFSYEQYLQTVARIDRKGQRFRVIIYILKAKDTVDELLVSVIKRKAKGQNALLESIQEYTNRRRRQCK